MKRWGNGSGEIHFHVPGLKHYETDEFALCLSTQNSATVMMRNGATPRS